MNGQTNGKEGKSSERGPKYIWGFSVEKGDVSN